MSRYRTRLRALEEELAQIRIEIEKAKFAKMESVNADTNSTALDQNIPYEDIQLHPEDVERAQQEFLAEGERMQAFLENRKREWYLSLTDFAP